jgi:hypothetical protein
METDVNELAEFLFLRNTNDAIVELSLGGVEDNKDFFFFCLDLFCKGLVMIYGEGNSLIINNVSEEQFNNVQKKMANAGISAKLHVHHDNDPDSPPDLDEPSLFPSVNMTELQQMPSHLEVEDYVFKINMTSKLTYNITFQLFHKVK